MPEYVPVPAGAENNQDDIMEIGSTLESLDFNEIVDVPVEGVAPAPPEWVMEGPGHEQFFTPPSSPTSDAVISELFDNLCDQEAKDANFEDEVAEGTIWTQAQFTEAELLWGLALEEVPSPSATEELALMSMESCLDSE